MRYSMLSSPGYYIQDRVSLVVLNYQYSQISRLPRLPFYFCIPTKSSINA